MKTAFIHVAALLLALPVAAHAADKSQLVPLGWDPALAGDVVMQRLVKVTAPQVKGAHDAEFACVGDRAYIVAEVNDVRPGEGGGWPEIYCAISIVNLQTLAVERIIALAHGEQVFENVTLPRGACFVPRILAKDHRTLRCYFASEHPGRGQAQTWFLDFDIASGSFEKQLHKAWLKTAAGTFEMQPRFFHADAAAQGFPRPAKDYGLYLFDSFKPFAGKRYVAINNFPGKQNALALVHDDLATFEILSHYNQPQSAQLSESAVNRLPDGTWMAICRNDNGNYHFTTSVDGRTWNAGREMPYVPNGTNSKPTFDRFGGTYYRQVGGRGPVRVASGAETHRVADAVRGTGRDETGREAVHGSRLHPHGGARFSHGTPVSPHEYRGV
ncbi:MAG: sialidase family protein [Planctomycetota bacterium]|nr:sialidase family protein [Planctomycetota bacterium]